MKVRLLLLLVLLGLSALASVACNEDQAGKILCKIRGCDGPSRL